MEKLDHTELDLFPLLESTPDLVCIAGKDGFFRNINKSVIDKLGYSRAELFSQPIANFIYPEDRELTRRERSKLLGGEPLINFQNRYVAKDNTIVWLDWTSVYFPDKEIVFAIAKDVTERKISEKEFEKEYIKFKGLASHFKKNIEQDRKSFAVELHEEIAQLAAVIKMDIDWIRYNSEDLSDFLKGRVEHALEVSTLLIDRIKRVSFSVSPAMLTDIGLTETLNCLCREFSVLNKIPCYFESSYNEADMTEEIKLDFFRICQEALNEVIKYCDPTAVKIKIEDGDDKVSLYIDAAGNKPGEAQHAAAFPGTNIRELVTSINGNLIIGQDENGSAISVSILKPISVADEIKRYA